jgi:glycosyltransferase involved in cell wall biosynthesis
LERAGLQTLGWNLREVASIPNGIDLPVRHLPRAAGPFANLPADYVLFLSRISWKKGLDRLITAWQWVTGIPLVIAGNDDEGYRAALEELARSLGVSDRVIFVGPASDADKWGLYEDAQLFVLPSYSENFGNVVAEAMGMGCPVVVSPEVGMASLVQSQSAGVVTSCEPVALADTIRNLLADPSHLRALGRRGRETVRELLSWGGVAEQTERLYRRLANGAGVVSTPVAL